MIATSVSAMPGLTRNNSNRLEISNILNLTPNQILLFVDDQNEALSCDFYARFMGLN